MLICWNWWTWRSVKKRRILPLTRLWPFSLIMREKDQRGSIKRSLTGCTAALQSAMQMRPIDYGCRCERLADTGTPAEPGWLFVHLCLLSSKITTLPVSSLIHPLSRSGARRQNRVGTTTPNRWRLMPSQRSPPPPIFSLLRPKPGCVQRNLSGWTETETTLHLALRGCQPWLLVSLKTALSFLPVPLCPGQTAQSADSPGPALSACRRPLLAHVLLAHSEGLITHKVNKIGDKNQLEERPGTREGAGGWIGSWSTMC